MGEQSVLSPVPQGLRGSLSLRVSQESTRGGRGAPGGYGRGRSCHHGTFSLGFGLAEAPAFLGEPQSWPDLYLEGKGIKSPTWG